MYSDIFFVACMLTRRLLQVSLLRMRYQMGKKRRILTELGFYQHVFYRFAGKPSSIKACYISAFTAPIIVPKGYWSAEVLLLVSIRLIRRDAAGQASTAMWLTVLRHASKRRQPKEIEIGM